MNRCLVGDPGAPVLFDQQHHTYPIDQQREQWARDLLPAYMCQQHVSSLSNPC